jgi:hypothetical protein
MKKTKKVAKKSTKKNEFEVAMEARLVHTCITALMRVCVSHKSDMIKIIEEFPTSRKGKKEVWELTMKKVK